MKTYFGLKPSYLLTTAAVGLLAGISISRCQRNKENEIFNHKGYRIEMDVNEDGFLDFITKNGEDVFVELGNGHGTYRGVNDKNLEEKAKNRLKELRGNK